MPESTGWRVPASIEVAVLTTASLLTLQHVAFRMVCGYSENDVARELGKPCRFVTDSLDELREELRGRT